MGVETPRLPVLTFHSIDDSGSPISVAPWFFRHQMDALAEAGWRTLTLDQFIAGYRAGSWPRRSVLLTFDDALANVSELAIPELARHGFTAVLFVVSGRVGMTNEWPGQAAWVPKGSLMSWSALADAANAGMEIGAHSVSHTNLARLPVAEAASEVEGSRRTIEERMGRPVRSFAFPYGESTPALVALVAESYEAGFGTVLEYATASSPKGDLPRLDAFYLSRRFSAASLDTRRTRAYLRFRRAGRHVRRLVPGGSDSATK